MQLTPVVQEQPRGRLQPLRKVDDFLLRYLADYGTRIPIHHLDHYPIEIRIDGKLSLESAFLKTSRTRVSAYSRSFPFVSGVDDSGSGGFASTFFSVVC